MTGNDQSPHTRPQGVFITLEAIYQTVTSIDDKIDKELTGLREEISKIKAQLAAQWVICGILVTAIGFLLTRGLVA